MNRAVKVATVDDFRERNAMAVEVNGRCLVVFKVEGQLFAVENYCPHAGYTLHDGSLEGSLVTCALHGAQFDVRDGRCVGGLSCSDIQTFVVDTSASGDIMVLPD